MLKDFKYNNRKRQKFYTRPKIHETGNPGRPVVSSVNCHTNTISKYANFHLRQIVKNIPSYVGDTTDFLQKLDKVKNVPNDCLLVALDVKSLYINIPNNEGIKAAREAYDNHPNKTVATKVIITFLSLILTLNNFVFNSINYLQIMGCAMGTVCEPAYANIFMAQFEKQHIYPYIKNKSVLYLRYIDDIFMIWTGTKQELLTFLEKLNSKIKQSNLNTIFQIAIYYFWTRGYITTRTTLYRQLSTENPLISNAISMHIQTHPKSLKRSIPYSQALRIKTICSTLTEYKKHCAIIERGYEENILKDETDKVDNINRKELLRKK